MSMPLKLLWSEGLTLDAQHFQQLDRYHEARLRHMAAAIAPYAWGVESARWSIEGDTCLRAESLQIIFRDGEIYQAPLSDELPLPVDLATLPADRQGLVFYAALPLVRAHGGNLQDEDTARQAARYVPVELQTQDFYGDALAVGLSCVRKQIRLLSELEPRQAYDCVPVLRVRRKADSTFEIDPAFMAPSLSLGAEPALQELLRGLLGKLAAKAEALYRLQRQSRGHLVEASGTGSFSFGMLSAVTTASAMLTHHASCGHCHPQQLFCQLLSLAGALMAFSSKFTAADLPRYDHETPAPAFHGLHDIICELLDTVVSSRYVPIQLAVDEEKSSYHRGRLVGGRADYYVAINAHVPALNLVSEIPRQLKIASPHDVEMLVRSALPGIPLTHLPQVPIEVPVRPGTCYFLLEPRGDMYERMLQAQAITIYAPASIDGLKIELFALTR